MCLCCRRRSTVLHSNSDTGTDHCVCIVYVCTCVCIVYVCVCVLCMCVCVFVFECRGMRGKGRILDVDVYFLTLQRSAVFNAVFNLYHEATRQGGFESVQDLYNALHYSTILYFTLLYFTLLYSALHYSTILYHALFYHASYNSTVLYFPT